ncbi:MAG TPA: NfeD family protein [Ktedonobacterales bacterium]|nr:NfeD family protein [Ktedonobacterales bacterium]
MLATDPLSLVFLGCIAFSAGFLIIVTITGAGHHDLHLGGHDLHLGGHGVGHAAGDVHVAHDLGHAAHVAHVGDTATHAAHAAHAADTAHAAHAATNGNGTQGALASPLGSAWSAVAGALEQAVNLYGLLIFLLVFGLLGYLLHNSANLPAVATLAVALVAGVLAAMLVGTLLARLFLLNEPPVMTRESSQLEGRLGSVSMAIRAGGIGEVIYQSVSGTRHSVGARSADGEVIPAGAEVVVLSYRDGIASVQPWERFMASVRAGRLPELEPLEHSQ